MRRRTRALCPSVRRTLKLAAAGIGCLGLVGCAGQDALVAPVLEPTAAAEVWPAHPISRVLPMPVP